MNSAPPPARSPRPGSGSPFRPGRAALLGLGVLLGQAVAVGPGAAAALVGGAEGVEVRVGATVEISRSHSHCWFPTIHQFHSGEIMVTMDLCADEANYASEFSGYCISRDGGHTWDERHPLGLGATQDGAWSEAPDENDSLWHWSCYPEPSQPGEARSFFGAMTKFSRGGRYSSEDRDVTFTLLQPVHMAPTWIFEYHFDGKVPVPDTKLQSYPLGMTWGNILRAPNGDLLCGAYFMFEEDARALPPTADPGGGPYRLVLLRSTDGGRHWAQISTIAAAPAGPRPSWMGKEGASEGSLAFLSDGRLYAVYRTGGGGMIGHSWSSDGGKTWTAPASTGIAGVAPRIHRLKNGMLVLVTGRPGPVVVRFNADGRGETWSEPITLFKEMSTRYTDVAEISPGRLLVVYDSVPYGWYEIPSADRDARNRVYGTFVDVSRN